MEIVEELVEKWLTWWSKRNWCIKKTLTKFFTSFIGFASLFCSFQLQLFWKSYSFILILVHSSILVQNWIFGWVQHVCIVRPRKSVSRDSLTTDFSALSRSFFCETSKVVFQPVSQKVETATWTGHKKTHRYNISFNCCFWHHTHVKRGNFSMFYTHTYPEIAYQDFQHFSPQIESLKKVFRNVRICFKKVWNWYFYPQKYIENGSKSAHKMVKIIGVQSNKVFKNAKILVLKTIAIDVI